MRGSGNTHICAQAVVDYVVADYESVNTPVRIATNISSATNTAQGIFHPTVLPWNASS